MKERKRNFVLKVQKKKFFFVDFFFVLLIFLMILAMKGDGCVGVAFDHGIRIFAYISRNNSCKIVVNDVSKTCPTY